MPPIRDPCLRLELRSLFIGRSWLIEINDKLAEQLEALADTKQRDFGFLHVLEDCGSSVVVSEGRWRHLVEDLDLQEPAREKDSVKPVERALEDIGLVNQVVTERDHNCLSTLLEERLKGI